MRLSSRVFLLLISLVLLSCLPLPASPESLPADRAAPFETIRLSASIVSNINKNSFNNFWDPRTGGNAEIEMPFYAGDILLGLHFFKNSRRVGTVPDFQSTFLYIGWGGECQLPLNLRWSNGVNAGNFFVNFGQDPSVNVKGTESELGFGIRTDLRYPFQSVWSVSVGSEYRVIYTERRIKYWFVSVGVSRTFPTPDWLRDFLE